MDRQRVRFCVCIIVKLTLQSAEAIILPDGECTMKLVHSPLMSGLLNVVQRGGDWAGPQPAQTPPHCTKCNSPSINGEHTKSPYWSVAVWQWKGCPPAVVGRGYVIGPVCVWITATLIRRFHRNLVLRLDWRRRRNKPITFWERSGANIRIRILSK